jgi:CheY-like chemotaxis protein
MKFSNTVRWILVLPTIAIAFFFCVALVVNLFPADWKGDWVLYVTLIITFLTGITVAPLHGKRFLAAVASLFILTCLFPPWQYTTDRSGYHSRKPAGNSMLFDPPTNPDQNYGSGVQIDFGRLFLEWVALAAVTTTVWVLVNKPAWPRINNGSRPQKFTPPRPPRIVVVDDEPIILNHLENMIRKCFKDATVLKFNDGDQVWQELLRTEPDLLITDMVRPGLSGWKMLPLLAAKKVTFPIIVMSGSANEKDVRKCAGPELNFSFLAKPFSQTGLHQELLKHLAGI